LSLLMLSLDLGVTMQKEAGEGGQLSAAMDKANAVASEEQGDYLLGAIKVLRNGVRFNWTMSSRFEGMRNVYAYSETRYATVVSYVLQSFASLRQTMAIMYRSG